MEKKIKGGKGGENERQEQNSGAKEEEKKSKGRVGRAIPGRLVSQRCDKSQTHERFPRARVRWRGRPGVQHALKNPRRRRG